MNRLLVAIIFLITTALPAYAATNTSGPWGVWVSKGSGFTSLSTAKKSPATAGKSMVISDVMNVNTLTIPSDRGIEVKPGGKIRYSGHLQINGPVTAGLFKWLEPVGAGTVSFGVGSIDADYPEWWGGAGDDSTDNKIYIKNAIDAFPVVKLSGRGIYRTTGAIAMVTGTQLIGSGATIKAGADNINLVTGSSTTGVLVQGITFVGNNTSAGITSGNGLYFTNSTNFKVIGNKFSNFGDDDGGNAINVYSGNTYFTISNNYISGGAGNTANDILVYMSSGYGSITDNVCISSNQYGIYTNGTGGLGKLVISGNTSNNHIRGGILTNYNSTTYMDMVVSNNITIDNGWAGIYVTGSGGTTILSDNVVRNCGGAAINNTNGGILISDTTSPVIVTGNYIYDSGKTSGGAARAYVSSAILITGASGDNLIANNIIDTATGSGVHGYSTFVGSAIRGNTILDCADSGIIANLAGATSIAKLDITGNTIKQSSVDGNGIYFVAGSGNISNLLIANNTVIGKKAGTGKKGLNFQVDTFSGIITGNIFTNWDTAVTSASGAATANIGTTCKFMHNTVTNSTVGMGFYSGTFYTMFTTVSGNGADTLGTQDPLAP